MLSARSAHESFERIRVENLKRFSTFVILLKENIGGLIEEGSSRVCRHRLGSKS
jgi:hypothetical protein